MILLQAKFPIYHRLSADIHLCRLINPYLEYSTLNNSNYGIFSTQLKLWDMKTKERYSILKRAKTPQVAKLRSIRQKCEQLLASDRLRFFVDCGHYESYPTNQEMPILKRSLRKCTKCHV